MRPLVTWLLVGTLAAIGIFAVRDALRSERSSAAQDAAPAPQPHPPPLGGPPVIAGRARLAAELSTLGARGNLQVTDATCRRFVLRLPALRWASRAGLPGSDCGLWDRPALGGGGGIAARQVNAETIVVTSGVSSYGFRGTSPAFEPDGTLSFVRDGRVYEWIRRCPEMSKIIRIERLHGLGRCVRRAEGVPASVHEVAWISGSDYAVVAGPELTASLWVSRRGRPAELFHSVGVRLGGLEASPNGRYVSARIDGKLTLFRTRGAQERIRLPTGTELVRSLTWSPDDRLAALATASSIDVFAPGRAGRGVSVPVSAALLDWR